MACLRREVQLSIYVWAAIAGKGIKELARTTVPATGGGVLDVLNKVASSYLFRRLIKALVTVFVMASLTFFLIRLMPGGPVEAYIANLVTQYYV